MSGSYSPTSWVDGAAPAIDAANLLKLERGARDAYTQAHGWFNVKDVAYGAKGDGVTDDTAAIQAAITACINAGGGVVYLPVGIYVISSSLNFSAFSGSWKGLTFLGAGSGKDFTGLAASQIHNASGTTALKLIATSSTSFLTNIVLRDFMIYNTVALADTAWTVDAQGVATGFKMENVLVDGQAFAGNGIRHVVAPLGHWTFDRVMVTRFDKGAGNGGVGIQHTDGQNPLGGNIRTDNWISQSGNGSLISCGVEDCNIAYEFWNNTIGVSMKGCKATRGNSLSGSIGVKLGSVLAYDIGAIHVEGYDTGVQIPTSAIGNRVQGGIFGANVTTGVSCDGQGNDIDVVLGVSGNAITTGVSMTGNASDNRAKGRIGSGATVTNTYSDSSSAKTNLFGNGVGEFIWNGAASINLNVIATTEAGATVVMDSGARYYDGSPIDVRFRCPQIQPGTTWLNIVLYDATAAATVVGTYGFFQANVPANLCVRLTPSAGTHQYQVKAYVDAGTGTVHGGPRGSGAYDHFTVEIARAAGGSTV